jgi:ubiquitin-protein ligase
VVGRIEFRDDYPEAPPKFFFERLPNGQYLELMNVYGTGEVCHFTINKEVWKKVKSPLKKIVLQLESLFYSPNLNDPANLELADIYENDQKEYWRRMHDQAKNFMSAEDVE